MISLRVLFFNLIFCSSIAIHIVNGLIDAKIKKGAPVDEMVLTSGQVIIRKSMTQAEAREFCENRGAGGGRLAVLLKPEDANELIKAVNEVSVPYKDDADERAVELGRSRRYWIGLTDISKEGEWVWMNEASVLKYDSLWYPGQPDHLTKTNIAEKVEHCVVLWNPIFREKTESHTFNDEPCVNKHYAICDA